MAAMDRREPPAQLHARVDAGDDGRRPASTAAEAAAAIARMETDPAYLAARRVQQLQHKLESVMANQQKLKELAPDYTRVESARTSRKANSWSATFAAAARWC